MHVGGFFNPELILKFIESIIELGTVFFVIWFSYVKSIFDSSRCFQLCLHWLTYQFLVTCMRRVFFFVRNEQDVPKKLCSSSVFTIDFICILKSLWKTVIFFHQFKNIIQVRKVDYNLRLILSGCSK